MITTYIVFFISLWIHGCRSQCAKDKPFYMIDKKCTNFNDVCVKKDSAECKSLLQACTQCPASNLTESALVNILTILRDQRNTTTSYFDARLNNFNLEIKSQMNLLIFLLILLIGLNFLVLIERMFHLCKRFHCKKVKSKNGTGTNHENLPLLKMGSTDDFEKWITSAFENLIDKKIDLLSALPGASSQRSNNDVPTNTSKTISIKVGEWFKPMTMQIGLLDNVVKIKNKIINSGLDEKCKDPKNMVLRLRGDVLDNNELLAKRIRSADDILYCDVDDKIDPNKIVILQLRGNMELPELIQINKYQTIDQFKLILSNLTDVGSENLKLFRGSDTLLDLSVLNDYNLVYAMKEQKRYLTFYSMFYKSDDIHISYDNNNTIKSLKEEICKQRKISVEDLILFFDNKILEDKDYIVQTGIESGSRIKYCHMIQKKDAKFEVNEDYSKIDEKYDPITKDLVTYKKYNISEGKYHIFLNELMIYDILQSCCDRFVKLNGVFRENNELYISMEKTKLLKPDKGYIKPKDKTLAKWAKQVLEGLKEMHDRGILHCSIKPSNIRMDSKNDIKLSSFGIAKYINCGDDKPWFQESNDSKFPTFRYMAPEVCNDEEFGLQADIWSFGATMTEIATGDMPFNGLDENKARKKILDTKRIEYNLQPSQLKDFIDGCLQPEPRKRPTVDDLLGHPFLTIA